MLLSVYLSVHLSLSIYIYIYRLGHDEADSTAERLEHCGQAPLGRVPVVRGGGSRGGGRGQGAASVTVVRASASFWAQSGIAAPLERGGLELPVPARPTKDGGGQAARAMRRARAHLNMMD